MTNAMEIVGGGVSEPDVEEFGLKPYNSDMPVVGQKIASSGFAPALIAPSAQLIIAVLKGVSEWLGAVQQDNKKREAFTKSFVEEAHKRFPNYNVVIIHTRHTTWGTWIKQHYELPMAVGTCGYEVYFSERGKAFSLANHGDGGYLNWAYYGQYNRQNDHTIDAIVY